jgi:hypothetical protein
MFWNSTDREKEKPGGREKRRDGETEREKETWKEGA